MIVFILMSGLFTPIESMPLWAQRLTWFNPIACFVEVMRLVMLKGATFGDISHYFLILLLFGIAINALATFNYWKTI
jgi:ABC-2 type transport system permease protein